MTIDQRGNIHRPTGAGGGQFAGHTRTAPTGELEDTSDTTTVDEDTFEPVAPRVYTVAPYRLTSAVERVEKANRRLERAGIEQRFTLNVSSRIVRGDQGDPYEVLDLTLDTPSSPSAIGGSSQFTNGPPGGGFVSYSPYDTGDRSAVESLTCDHCGTARRRSKIVRVVNPDGEVKQIGSTCLPLFLGVRPEGLWVLEYEPEIFDDLIDDDVDGISRGTRSVLDGRDLFHLAFQVVDEDGYLSRSRAGYHETSTADKVLDRFWDSPVDPEIHDPRIEEVLAHVDSLEGGDDYVHNLKAALLRDDDGGLYIRRKHVPLAVSAIGSWQRHKEREVERKRREEFAAQKQQAFLAPAGEKLKGRGVTARVLSIREGGDYGYGPSWHVSMIDSGGHVLYWKASNHPGVRDGDGVSIDSATVKDNRVSDYNGDWETVLTRARVTVTERSTGDD